MSKELGIALIMYPTEGFWGILKAEMYQMYEITDEASLRFCN